MITKKALVVTAALALGATGVAYAGLGDVRVSVEFYKGHSHGPNDETIGAPEHSGGTNRLGCHNGSVPYHCH